MLRSASEGWGKRVVGGSGLCYTAEASFPAPGNAFEVPGPLQSEGGEPLKAYELMLIMRPNLEDEARESVLDKVRGIITAEGGTVDSEEVWGKRRLAHEIAHEEEGDYYVILFHAGTATVAELDRVLHITDQVLRFMTVRRDDLK